MAIAYGSSEPQSLLPGEAHMLAFVIRRAVQAVLVMIVVALIAFTLFRFVGDPVNQMVGIETSRAGARAAAPAARPERPGVRSVCALSLARAAFRFRRLLSVQAAGHRADRRSFSGDHGALHRFRRCSRWCSASRWASTPRSQPQSWLSRVFLTVSLIGISLPTFLIGILLIFVFAVSASGWLPSFGRGDGGAFGFWTTGLLTRSGLKAIILPAVTLGLFQMTLIMRLVRSEMIEVLRTDYIKFARARGLPDRIIHFGHALKNTLVPVMTIAGLQLGSIIAFAIITETVFQWPGMGLMFLKAVQNADIPIMSAYLLLVAAIFVVINLVVDLLYVVVDPRIRIDAASA